MKATSAVTVRVPPGSQPGGTLAALARVVAAAPFTGRARRELLFCGVDVPLAVAGFAVTLALLLVGVVASVSVVGALVGLAILAILATGIARRLGLAHLRLAASLLGEQIATPAPFQPGRGFAGRLGARLRDGPGWRAVTYLLLKLPVAVFEAYAAFFWVAGLINLTFPFWWRLFRNHPPGTQLRPVPVFTPFGEFGVVTFSGTFLVFAAGAAMVLVAPWLTRAVTMADGWLMRSLLGPGRLAQRVRDLEETRALAVDDSAALLRRLERDLHDGAQVRLAALAMNLGMAKEKLGAENLTLDVAAVRQLVDAAHRGAKDALIELRTLARGIHPPVLDNGLADALATLAAGSVIPAAVTIAIPERPTPAIETIAYYCAAELLANAAKHSQASKIDIRAAGHQGLLLLSVADDGIGGADLARGTGLSGLAQRVSTVDGRLDITSPLDGPTQITVQLPLRA